MITDDGGATTTSINGWIVELFDTTGTNPTTYAFFIENTETLPADISTNVANYRVHSGGVNNGGTMPYASILDFTTTPICFTAGTLIRVIEGVKAVEDLRQGDLVWTKDDGYQPVRWIGLRHFDMAALERNENLRPIRINANSLGGGLPQRDLLVSQQHRILVNSRITQRMTNENEVLVAARHLLQVDGIDVVHNCKSVTYVHFLLDRHHIVEANGAETETLFTGPEALKSVTPAARLEILSIFPELADLDHAQLPSARVILSGRKARKLAQRHKANKKQLMQ